MEPVSAVVSITCKLIGLLGKVKQLYDERADNKDVMQEIKLFITQLERDLDVLKGLTPRNNSSTLAAESLLIYVRKATDYVDKCLEMGYFRSMWNVHTVKMKLARIRENVLTQFQITLQYIQIDVSLNGQREQEEFQHRLHRSQAQSLAALDELSSDLAGLNSNIGTLTETVTSMREEAKESAADARSERQGILKLLLDLKALAMDERQHQDFSALLTAQIRHTEAQTTEAEKFFEDAQQQPRPADNWPWFEDPITKEVMCDPIKASDGRTYDRWTIIDHNLVRCPYDADMANFGIAFDDIDVRSRLFERFPQQEELFRLRRQKHRQEALDHVARGENADALTKLKHVVQWNRRDRECTDLISRLTQQSMPHQEPFQVFNLMQLPDPSNSFHWQVPLELRKVAKGDSPTLTFSTTGDLKLPEPSSWMPQQQTMDTHKARQEPFNNVPQFGKPGIVPTSESVAMADSGAPRPTHDADGAPPSYIVLHPHAVPSAGEEFELVDVSKWAEFGIGVVVRGEVQYLYAEGPQVLATLNSYRDSVGIARTVWQVVADAPSDGSALSPMSFALKNKDTGARLYYDSQKGSFYGAWVESNLASRLTHWRLWRSSQDVSRYKLQYIQGPGRGGFASWPPPTTVILK